MLTLSVDVSGVERKLATLAENVRDLTPALRTFGDYLQARIKQRYAQGGPGWPGLAESTVAKRQQQGLRRLDRRLSYEVKRAEASYERQVAKAAVPGTKGRTPSYRAVERRLLARAEFRRQRAGGSAAGSLLEGKAAASLSSRVERAKGGPVLGRLGTLIAQSVGKGSVTERSKVAWAGVHEHGGTAGHGARIPARPAFYVEDRDLDVLVETLRNRMLLGVG